MFQAALIDSNVDRLRKAADRLGAAGFLPKTAATGREGLALTRSQALEALVVGFRLSDMSGLSVVASMRQLRPELCIVVTDVETCRAAVRAMRCGADYCIEQRSDSQILVRTLTQLLRAPRPAASDSAEFVPHAFQRWANVIVAGLRSPGDLRTLAEWGRFVGVSVGGLRNWCRTAGLPARRSLLLMRVLRAIVMDRRPGGRPEELLNVVDRRTLDKLLLASGGTKDALPSSIDDCLARQTIIHQPRALDVLRAAITRSGEPGPTS